MASGLIGKKLGMTQVFGRNGSRIPVTVIKAGPCTVLQKKTTETDGYNAIQLGFEERKARRVNRPLMGHYRKAGKGAFTEVAEFRVGDIESYEVGQELGLEQFTPGDKVAVTGKSKGRGFQGVVRRHGFSGGRATHGSMAHRRPGAIGQCAYPAKVFKGKRMAGQMGNRKVTIRNLEIVEVDATNHLMLVKGAIPGAANQFIMIKPA